MYSMKFFFRGILCDVVKCCTVPLLKVVKTKSELKCNDSFVAQLSD